MFTLAGAFLLASSVITAGQRPDPSDFVNPRFVSPSGEMCVVVRRYPKLGDFQRVTSEEYWRRDPLEEWLEQYPLAEPQPAPVEPVRAALYRRWPSGYQELLAEVSFPRAEVPERVLVADDGHFVTHSSMDCGAEAELATIHAPDGSVVRTLKVRDVVTNHDQRWLCRGGADAVRLSILDDHGALTLRATILVTEEKKDPEARRETIDIDLRTGAVPSPTRNRCPSTVRVVAEPDDGTHPAKLFSTIGDDKAFDADDVVPIASSALLERAVVRIEPEYPVVAEKARIAGKVRVQLVVGRDGRVQAARVSPLPFGIDQAVKAAIVRWELAPYPSPENAARFSGSFIFRFEIVRHMPLETTVCH